MSVATMQLPVSALHPNDYNPNRMDKAGFAELTAEVRHLGRIPKPIVVRRSGDGYVIVDGEHGWRAATEAGIEEVTCEVIEVDDFEARRQTYKRNQHGAHDAVGLGRMFQQMMEDRDISLRGLAKEIGVSEGKVRNTLAYVKVADLRNCYAGAKKGDVAELSVRQVRTYLKYPPVIANAWVSSGADLDAFESLNFIKLDLSNRYWGSTEREATDHYFEISDWVEIAKRGLAATVDSDFIKSMQRAAKLWAWTQRYEGRIARCEEYAQHVAAIGCFHVEEVLATLHKVPLVGDPQRLILSPERWSAVLKTSHSASTTQFDFAVNLSDAIEFELELQKWKPEHSAPAEEESLDLDDIEEQEQLEGVPQCLVDSDLSLEDKLHFHRRLERLDEETRNALLPGIINEVVRIDQLREGRHPKYSDISDPKKRDEEERYWRGGLTPDQTFDQLTVDHNGEIATQK